MAIALAVALPGLLAHSSAVQGAGCIEREGPEPHQTLCTCKQRALFETDQNILELIITGNEITYLDQTFSILCGNYWQQTLARVKKAEADERKYLQYCRPAPDLMLYFVLNSSYLNFQEHFK